MPVCLIIAGAFAYYDHGGLALLAVFVGLPVLTGLANHFSPEEWKAKEEVGEEEIYTPRAGFDYGFDYDYDRD
jgi:hypothetical protein